MIPANNILQENTEKTTSPGAYDPNKSLINPTVIGERKLIKLETLRMAPIVSEILIVLVPGNSIGIESHAGT